MERGFARRFGSCGVLCILLALASGTDAAELSGTVLANDGQPVPGALVTLTREDGLFVETVYSNADGRYVLRPMQQGKGRLRARRPGFVDVAVDVDAAAGGRNDFRLVPVTDPVARSEQLTASAHFARLPFERELDRQWFQVECLTCHQIGNLFTRLPRTDERWREIMTRMLGFYGVTDAAWIDRYARLLGSTYNGEPHAAQQTHSVDVEALPARILQWKLPGAVIAHDVELYSKDGRFYTVDQGTDQIYITDPVTTVTETYNIPDGGIPQGGKFFKLTGNRTPVGLTVPRGPHSLQEGPDGHYYTTDTVSGQIGEFDPVARTYVGHDIGGNGLYPHTLRFDRQGRVWYTVSFSNQVGMLDTRTDRTVLIDLPPDTDREQMPARVPYGIDVHPVDGSVWYSSLMANRIGRIDPQTLEVQSFTPPTVGPRRMRFAKDGTLWIPDFGPGRLVRLDTRSMQYEAYTIPPLSPGEVEAPYALAVHPQTQEVWITANMSDRLFRFLPAQKRFVAYPLPTQGIYLRDIIFTPEGMVCSASSPMPAAVTVEGGMQEIVCLDPVGDLPLPRAAR
jgi:virginiamycin B lyase